MIKATAIKKHQIIIHKATFSSSISSFFKLQGVSASSINIKDMNIAIPVQR